MPQRELSPISQSGRDISRQEISEIQEMVELFPKLSRWEMVATICENLSWLTAAGNLKLDACMKLMEKLENKGLLRLPKKQKEEARKLPRSPITETSRTDPGGDIRGNLRDIGLISVEVAEGKESTGLWNEYVSRYHYLGYKRPFGYFLRYFVEFEGGLLGCLLFSGASKALSARDSWIGWTQKQRLRNLAWVTNNSRFLIFPWVRVKNLASHVLGQVLKRIKADWEDRWGYSPVLVETFVDPGNYHGSCYKASNWQYLGMSTGEGLVRKGKKYTTSPKMIFARPLVKDFRSFLCSEELKGRVES